MNKKIKVKIAVAVLAAILMIIVVVQNRQMVDARAPFVTITMPLAVLLLLTFVVGIVVGLLVAWGMASRQKPPKRKA